VGLQALSNPFAASMGSTTPCTDAAERGAPEAGLFLQASDPAAGGSGLGIAAAMGRMPDGRVGARLVLFPSGQRIVLFTGEELAPTAPRVGGLAMERDPDGAGLRLRFDGPALLAEDGSRHFQSEIDQASARIVELRADLRFARVARHPFGELCGWVAFDGERRDVRTCGFSALPPLRAPDPHGGVLTRVAVGFGRDLGAALTLAAGGSVEGEWFRGSEVEEVRATSALSAPPRPPAPFAIALGNERLDCRPLGHLSFLRPLGVRRYARITLGVASVALSGGARGSGLYEHVQPVEALVEPAAALDGGSDGA
jgi:hypothetical protein